MNEKTEYLKSIRIENKRQDFVCGQPCTFFDVYLNDECFIQQTWIEIEDASDQQCIDGFIEGNTRRSSVFVKPEWVDDE